jgi:hypothetical protein
MDSNKEAITTSIQKFCLHYAEQDFEHLVLVLKQAGRERLVGRKITLEQPDILVGLGIEVFDYSLTITALPELQPAPPPKEPWEGYEGHLHIGDSDGQAVFLDKEDTIAHVQVIGASRFGKSKLIEYVVRQRIGVEGVCVIDPNQQLYDDIMTWCAHRGELEGIRFLDPSDEKSEIGFNPFHLPGERTPERISARASRLLITSLKAMKFSGDSAVLAERIMTVLFYVIIEQDLPITELRAFMTPRLFARRDEIMANCQNEDIRDEWAMLLSGKQTDSAYISMMQSSATRLVKLFLEPGVKRVLTASMQLNLSNIVKGGATVIINLKDTPDILSESARDILGTFIVDEIWNVVKARTKKEVQDYGGFNLFIDEFHNFAAPEFAKMLKEGAKSGLHLWLINHELDSLDPGVRRALKACHTRIAFGGTSQKDATAVLEGSRPGKDNDLRDEIAAIPGLTKRRFILSRVGKRNMFCATAEVRTFPVRDEVKEAYQFALTRLHKQPSPAPQPAPPPAPQSDPTPAASLEFDFEAILRQYESEKAIEQSMNERGAGISKETPQSQTADHDDFYY